jgi:hypothetical protein
MADLVIPAAPALVTIPGVELCAVGTWNASTGTTTFTSDDLAACVSALDCPGVRNPVLKLGHDEADGAGIRWDGEPAIGWIANMRLADNDAKIVGDYTGMPGWLAGVLPSAYPDRSIEMYRPFVCQIGHTHPAVITAVALLGVSHPAVGVLQSLQDVAALYQVQPAAARAVALRHGDVVYLATTSSSEPSRRDLTDLEAASGMDPDAVQSLWQTALDALLKTWEKITQAWRAALATLVKAAVDSGDVASLADMELDAGDAETVIVDAMADLAEKSAAQMAAEAATQGVTVEPPDPDRGRLGQVADALARLLAVWLSGAAAREALRIAGPDSTGQDVADAVTGHLEGLSDTFLRDQLGAALSTAQAAGRFDVLDAAPAAQYVASEVLDEATCQKCRDEDGHVFAGLAEAKAAYANGGYIDCLGGLRCRGIIVAVWPANASTAPADRPRRRVPVHLRIEGPAHGDQGVRLRVH